MMQDENILIRALEPEDLEYLYKWENDMDLWDVSDTLTPFSHFTLKKYIENAHVDIYTSKQLRLMIVRKSDQCILGTIDITDFVPLHSRGEFRPLSPAGRPGNHDSQYGKPQTRLCQLGD